MGPCGSIPQDFGMLDSFKLTVDFKGVYGFYEKVMLDSRYIRLESAVRLTQSILSDVHRCAACKECSVAYPEICVRE
jgi:hypothetical protein